MLLNVTNGITSGNPPETFQVDRLKIINTYFREKRGLTSGEYTLDYSTEGETCIEGQKCQ